MTIKATFTLFVQQRPIMTAFLGVMAFSGLSLATGLISGSYGINPIMGTTYLHFILLLGMIGVAWRYGFLATLSTPKISLWGGIYAVLWFLPIFYSLALNPTILQNQNPQLWGQVLGLSLGQEWFYRGLIFLFLMRAFQNRNLSVVHGILVSAVLSSMGHLYTLFTPAPLVYVLYQIVWATLYGMMAGYTMVLLRSVWIVGLLHAITSLYVSFDAPVFGVPAMYVSLLWFCIMALIGRLFMKKSKHEQF